VSVSSLLCYITWSGVIYQYALLTTRTFAKISHMSSKLAGPSDATGSKETEQRQPLYEASTQFRNWRFSPEGLAQIRAKLNEAAVAAIKNSFEIDQVTFPPNPYPYSRYSYLSFSQDPLPMFRSCMRMKRYCL
jgi:hypothetical protein